MEILWISPLKMIVGSLFILPIFRLLRKDLSEVTPLNMLSILVLGDIFSGIILDTELGVWTLVLLPIWGFFIWVIELLLTNETIHKKVEGKPKTIIEDGKIITEVMEEARLNEEEIKQRLRFLGIFELENVQIAYLENSGEITAKPKDKGESE